MAKAAKKRASGSTRSSQRNAGKNGKLAGKEAGKRVRDQIELAKLTAADIRDFTASFIKGFREELKGGKRKR